MVINGSAKVGMSSTLIFQEDIADTFQHNGNLALEISNNGAGALNEFIIALRSGPGAEWFNFVGDSDFDDISLITSIQFVSTNTPHDLAAGAKSNILINVGGVDGIAIRAKAAAATEITIKGNLR